MSSFVSFSSISNSDSKNDTYLSRPPTFNGYIEQVGWWKSKLYSLCITQDEEIWDVIEDDTIIVVDKDRKSISKNGLTADEKKRMQKASQSHNHFGKCFIIEGIQQDC